MKIASLILSLFFLVYSPITRVQQAKRPFTVADDIGLTLFQVQGGSDPEIHFSPDGRFFAVWTERGRLDQNQVEDSLRFYRTQDVEAFLEGDSSRSPEPAWI